MIYALAKIIFGFYFNVFNRFKVIGKENIYSSSPLIIYGNHQSMADIFCLNLAFGRRRIVFMAKESLFRVPVIKHVVKAYGAFPVNREKTDITAVKNALKVLRSGGTLGIFPEGTRVKDINESDAKGGIAMLAEKTGAELQPVRIIYKRRFMLFNSIKVVIGKSFSSDNVGISADGTDRYKAAGKALMERVYGLGS